MISFIKKSLIIASVGLLNTIGTQAQNAKESNVTYNKMNVPAYIADFNVPSDLMQTTLEDRLKKATGTSGSKSKGYRKYEGVTFSEISPNKIDVYTKVSGKKNNSNVIMLVSTGYDNFINGAKDATIANNSIAFLNKLTEDATNMKAAIDLAAQQKALKEAEEKLKKEEKEKERLAKKKAKLEKQLEDGTKSTEKAGQAVEREKTKLEDLKNSDSNAK